LSHQSRGMFKVSFRPRRDSQLIHMIHVFDRTSSHRQGIILIPPCHGVSASCETLLFVMFTYLEHSQPLHSLVNILILPFKPCKYKGLVIRFAVGLDKRRVETTAGARIHLREHASNLTSKLLPRSTLLSRWYLPGQCSLLFMLNATHHIALAVHVAALPRASPRPRPRRGRQGLGGQRSGAVKKVGVPF
jgi:hypothetical protein